MKLRMISHLNKCLLLILFCLFGFLYINPVYASEIRTNSVDEQINSINLDANDISFLIPPNENSIYLKGEDEKKSILTKRLFNKFQDFKTKGNPGVNNLYEKMIITGFRFDPCGPISPRSRDLNNWDLEKEGACGAPNIRLIAQPYENGEILTSALHVVFTLGNKLDQDPNPEINRKLVVSGKALDTTVRANAIKELKQMKFKNHKSGIDTKGIPIGIHPAYLDKHINSQRTKEFSQEFADFVHKYAQEDQFFVTSVMFTVDPNSVENPEDLLGKERWAWQKFGVSYFDSEKSKLAHPDLYPDEIPRIETNDMSRDYANSITQQLTSQVDVRKGLAILPRSTPTHNDSEDEKCLKLENSDLEMILNVQGVTHWDNLTDVLKALEIANLMENPDNVLVNTEDCATCHLATTSRLFLEKNPSDSSLSRFTIQNKFNNEFAVDSALGLREEDQLWQSEDGVKIASFSFFKGKPSISQRTVNETLEAVHIIKQLK